MISFDPYIPLALWVPLALASAGVLAWYALASRIRLPGRRFAAIVALMAIAVGVPLVILLNPTWVERVPPPPGKPLLTVLVDSSMSMATRDAEGGEDRYRAAARIAQKAASQLADRFEVRVRTFDTTSSEVAPDSLEDKTPSGAGTDLNGAIDAALDDERPQGQAVLLLSDGMQNLGGGDKLRQSVARAKALAAPIYTKTLGGPGGVRDIELELKRQQEVAFVKQRVPVPVTLRQRGSLATQVQVALRLDDKEIEKHSVKLTPNGTAEEVFYVTQKAAGLYRYEVRAETLPGEVTPLNNAGALLVRVIDRPVRVLLMEGKPYWDTKFLIRTLSMDESVELTSVVQLAPGRLLQRKITRQGENKADAWEIKKEAGSVLSDPATLDSYQIVILGRSAEVFLSEDAMTKLKKWLNDQEGSLVCFRGAPSSQIGERLGELMPVRWTPAMESRFRVQLTEDGQARGWLPASGEVLSGMPSLAATARPEVKEYLGVVLAASVTSGGQPAPVVTYRPVGNYSSGRVVAVEGAGMWRWAFLPPQFQDRDDLYGSLWRSLVRWLVTNVGLLPSERLSLRPEPDKGTFAPEENVGVALLVRESQWSGGAPRIELSGPALASPRIVACRPRGSSPGQYHAELGKLAEGRYQVRVVGAGKDEVSAVAAIDVKGNLGERLDVAAQPQHMAWIARESGGAAMDSADPDSLAQQFDEHLARSRPERISRSMAWDRWWVLASALVLWGTTWGVRRWSGLV